MLFDEKTIQEADYLILQVAGGIGKNIMATAVVRNLKEYYPDKDIIVMASCPDIFMKNPRIKKVIGIGQPFYFYEDYILGSKSIILNAEPYQHYDYLYRNQHLVVCWCNMLGIPCNSIYPEMYFNAGEERMAQLYLQSFDREMVLFQHQGGKKPEEKDEKNQIIAKSGMYKRSLPEKIVKEISSGLIERGYMVGSVQHENQYCPPKAEKISFPIRATLALIPHVKAVIGIDSFLQHGTVMFQKKSLVIWGGTNPKVLGYQQNINMTREVCDNPMCHRPNSYLWDFEPNGFMWDCPHNDICMNHSSNNILREFDKMIGGKDGKKGNRDKPPGTGKEKKGIRGNTEKSGEKLPASSGSACPCK